MSQQNYNVTAPEDLAGVFADFVMVWQTPETFVLDFAAVTAPADFSGQPGAPEISAQVVSRVRIPPSQVFEIMKALEHQLSMWEARTGKGELE